jgi:hypothetical protein
VLAKGDGASQRWRATEIYPTAPQVVVKVHRAAAQDLVPLTCEDDEEDTNP